MLLSRILLGLSIAAVYFVNFVGTRSGWGQTPQELGANFPFPYTPPGRVIGLSRAVVFSLLLIRYIYQRKSTPTTIQEQSTLRSKRKRATISCLLNITRIIFTAQERNIAAVAIIILLMISLIQLVRLSRHQSQRFIDRITRGIYAGWVTVATCIPSVSVFAHTLAKRAPDSIAMSTPRTYGVRALGLVVVLWIYRRYRNLAALLRSLAAMSTSAWVFFA